MIDTEEMREERAGYVALDVVRCACGRVYLVRRGKEDSICVCGDTTWKSDIVVDAQHFSLDK